MKLKYRGFAYEYNPTKVDTVEGKAGGIYRGIPWQQRIPQIVQVTEPSLNLKYRGVGYCKGRVKLMGVDTEPEKVVVTNLEMLSEEKPLTQPKKLKAKH